MPDYNKIDLTNVKFDGDPFNVTEGVTPEEPPEPTFDPTTLPASTNTPTDADEIITGESGTWVRKTLSKLWDYIKDKLGIKSNGDTGKYLNEKGEWNPLVNTRSYVGMIIHSTTLDTEAKVKSFYGGTTWIQHSGYMLRGATSSVTANRANNDGGADSVSYTPKGSNSGGSVSGTAITLNQMRSHSHNKDLTTQGGFAGGSTGKTRDCAYSGHPDNSATTSSGGSQNHNHGFTNPTFTGTAATINTLPKYKNVYIWERTA